MKKKILAIITTMFMVFTLAGCSAQGLSLSKELQKVGAWESVTQTGDINVTVKAGKEDVKITADYEAFTNQKDTQMEMLIVPKSMQIAGKEVDLTQGTYKFSAIQMYVNGFKFYISTSYITDLCRIAGVDAADIMDVSKHFVALDLSDTMKEAGMDIDKLMDQSASSYEMYEKMNTELPIKQDGSKYTINLTADQMVDALFGLVNETFTTQEATLRATYKAMGLSDQEIDQMLVLVKEVYGDKTKEQVKPVVKGSTMKVVYDFSDDKYTTNVNIDLKLALGEEEVAMSITVNDTARKADKKMIVFPSSVKTYTMQDLEELMASEAAAENAVNVAKADTFVQGGKVYVPVKSTLAAAGLEVQYDAATKTVSLKGTDLIIPAIIKGNTAYASVDFLQTIGVTCNIAA